MNIHLIEDDPMLAKTLQLNLELEGHRIFLSENIKKAFDTQDRNKIDFVILDLGLPDGSGFDLLKKLRTSKNEVPVIILTAQTDEDSVVQGLQLGANDYMKKPYSFKELRARMLVTMKKPIAEPKKLQFEDLSLNLDTRICYYKQKAIELNRREFDILSHFVQRAEMIVTRESLLEFIDKDSEIFDRTIDSHISHLRKKLRSSDVLEIKISSVYGLGYRLEKNDEK